MMGSNAENFVVSLAGHDMTLLATDGLLLLQRKKKLKVINIFILQDMTLIPLR